MLMQKMPLPISDPTVIFTSFYKSPIGFIKLETNGAFITCIKFLDEESINMTDLKSHDLLIEATEQLIQYFNGARRAFSLPLEQPGTAFQQKIWSELQHIPFGKTISYLELALIYGDRKATRAVANANSKNELAIAVPCHRVIGAQKQMVGYAGGLWRKRWLLDHEKNITYGIQKLF